jgi:N6-L-threonylcarbamoyladenine synthase
MILAIESSCDESALALFDPKQGIVLEKIASQIELHSEYGGVVPDLASREHLNNFPLILEQLEIDKYAERLSHVMVTYGPGLAGCLAMGGMLAKSLAFAYDLPVMGVNHLRGHAWSPFIALHESDPKAFQANLRDQLPHLGLIVSGGNTILFEIDTSLAIRILAETVDDAAGEALDKGGKLLGLAYPAGPRIEALAKEGDKGFTDFPKAMGNRKDKRFSFSGLKTSLRYKLDKLSQPEIDNDLSSICASYQEAVFYQLVKKTSQLINEGEYKSLGLSGGVANNVGLKGKFKELSQSNGIPFYSALPKHSGDNAGMIAFAGFIDLEFSLKNVSNDFENIEPALSLVDQ